MTGRSPLAEAQSRQEAAETQLAHGIVDAAHRVPTRLGLGLPASVCEMTLAPEVTKRRGPRAGRRVPVTIRCGHIQFDEGLRADLLVGDRAPVESKSADTARGVHSEQTLTHLRVADRRLDLVISFSSALITKGITRVVSGLQR